MLDAISGVPEHKAGVNEAKIVQVIKKECI